MRTKRDGAIRVLLVDDHAVVRQGLFAFLGGEADLDVVGAASGAAEALELLAQLDAKDQLPHVVVMDLKMEPIDGIASTRQIRELYSEIEIVVMTSFGEVERVYAALDAGASGYLLKDADADEIAVAIRAAHRGELQLDPALARRFTASIRNEPGATETAELTPREQQVLELLADGKTNKAIAAQLAITERTARTHVSKILAKLELKSRTQAALWATRRGAAPPTGLDDSSSEGDAGV
jgi:DNA-binding NarL/FixJ family response regulator